jgi:hypothetical protein
MDLATERAGAGAEGPEALSVRVGFPVADAPRRFGAAGLDDALAVGEDEGPGDPAVLVGAGSWVWPAAAASATPSENGPPTSPAAPNPTPTAATANAAHNATRASRLSMPAILVGGGLTAP